MSPYIRLLERIWTLGGFYIQTENEYFAMRTDRKEKSFEYFNACSKHSTLICM